MSVFRSMGPGLFRSMGPPGAVPSRDELGSTPAGGAGRRTVVGQDRGWCNSFLRWRAGRRRGASRSSFTKTVWFLRADAAGAPRAGGPVAGPRGWARSRARARRTRQQVRVERARDRAHRRPHARATLSADPDVLLAHAVNPPSRAGSPAAEASEAGEYAGARRGAWAAGRGRAGAGRLGLSRVR